MFLGVVLAVHLSMNGKVGAVLNNARVGNAMFWCIGALGALAIGFSGWETGALDGLKNVNPILLTAGAISACLVFAIGWLIPHREPFLLLDAVTGLDLEKRTIEGGRRIRADDPVLAGHFPGNPIYPGVLQVKAMGQLAACLLGASSHPREVRAVRIHQAVFFEPVLPGDGLTLYASVIEDDGLTATVAGQVFRDQTLCSLAVQEVYFVE